MTSLPQPRNSLEIGMVSSALETDYEVLEEIGRGGMAVVYRAREKELDREVAIKVLPSVLSFDAGFVERFQREAKTAAQLEHPSIVPIYRVGKSGNVIFFVMKLLRGQNLSAVLRERPKLTVDEVRRVLMDTASALGYAAKRGVVHRDIKPDNILLDHDGRCVITDFGIAKTSGGPLTAAGTSMGTPRYMSPEHAQGQPLDGRSDIYSLGVVAYQCLLGDIPFDGPDPFAILYKHINTQLPQPQLTNDNEKMLFHVIEKMLAKRPEDRYQTADELIMALGGPTTPTSTTLVAGIWASRLLVEKTEIIPTGAIGQIRKYLPTGWRAWAYAVALIGVSALAWKAFKPPLRPATDATRRSQGAADRIVLPPVTQTPSLTGVTPTGSSTGAVTKAAVATPVAPRPKLPNSNCPARPKTFTLMLDEVGAQQLGKPESGKPAPKLQLPVGYDVCGLAAGAPYTWEYQVSRVNQPRFSGLRGNAVRPIGETFPEVANSPRSHGSRSVDISTLPPGRYALDVAVTDAKKRKAAKTRQFDILEPK